MSAKPRPKHLDLPKIRLPLPGFVSILHRISGAGLFLCLPLLLHLFQLSLTAPAGFEALAGHWFVKLMLAGLLWAFLHHLCAGIRFLALDLHLGSELAAARLGSKLVLAVSLALTLILGGRLLW